MTLVRTRNCALGLLALGLSACASGESLTESAQRIPAVQKNEGRIVVYRKTVLGAAVQPKVLVNGVETDKCQPKKVFFVDVAPGKNVLTAQTENKASLEVDVKAGQTAYVECTIGFGFFIGHVYLKPANAAKAAEDTKSIKFGGLYERK